MLKHTVPFLLLALSALPGTLAHAQPPDPAPVRAALQPAAGFVGTWIGEGWIQLGPDRRQEFRGTETVHYRLGDTVLVIEGLHYARVPDGVDAPVVHHALAVVSWNPRNGYQLASWLANGRNGVFSAELTEGQLTWTMSAGPTGMIRYTSQVDENTWHDVGERSTNGQSWVKFFEMRLTRQD